MTNKLDTQTVSHYLSFLDNSEEVFCYSLMDAESNEVLKGHGVKFGSSQEILELLPRIKVPFSMHITLNSMKIGGRRRKDVERVRVLCVDIDTPKESEEIRAIVKTYRPQLVTESSPKKFHLYWKVAGAMTFDVWEKWQRLLNYKIGGDLSLAVLTHTIRVPGIERVCKDGSLYLPRIAFDSGERTNFNSLELEALFPEWKVWHEGALEFIEQQKKNRKRLTKQYLEGKDTRKLIKDSETLGGRNSTLYSVVKNVCVEKKIESEVEAMRIGNEFNAEFAANHQSGALEQSEVEKTVVSAFKNAQDVLEAMRVRDVKAFDTGSLIPEGIDQEIETMEAGLLTNGHHAEIAKEVIDTFLYDFDAPGLKGSKYSETAIVERVIQRFGTSLLRVKNRVFAFNAKTHEWIVQNSEHFAEVAHFVKCCIDDLIKEDSFIERFGKTKKGEIDLEKLQNNIDRFNSFKVISTAPRILVNDISIKTTSMDTFDSKTEWVLCSNGTLNLVTGELRVPKDTDYFLGNCGITYNPEAKCDSWLEFLNEVFSKNPETSALIEFMQEVFGYSLSGDISEKKIFCHYGSGGNGKSKILQALLLISGPNATIIDPDDMVTSKGKFSRAFERFGAKIEGHRVAVLDDLEIGDSWNDSNLKNITEPQCRARAENQRSRVFANRCKLHLGLNEIPRASQETEAITRRLCIIHYLRRFEMNPTAEKSISRMIQDEAQGIFTWAVTGYQRMKERGGITYLDAQKTAIAEYRESAYTLETALRAFYVPGTGDDFIFTSEILEDIKQMLVEQGENPLGLSAVKVGLAISREFGVKPSVRWSSDKQMPLKGVCLKRKFAKKTPTSIF